MHALLEKQTIYIHVDALGVSSFFMLKQGISRIIKHYHALRSKLSTLFVSCFLHDQDLSNNKAPSITKNAILLQLIFGHLVCLGSLQFVQPK
jgi:hypothetical protein